MRIGQQAIVIYASKVVSSIVGFVAFVYLSNKLGAEVIGQYHVAIALVSWVTLFSGKSLALSAAKRLSEEGSDGDRYIGASVGLQIALVLAILIVTFVFRGAIASYTGIEEIAPIWALIVAFSAYELVGGVLRGQDNAHIEGLLDPIKISSARGLQVVAFLVGGGLAGILYGQALGFLLTMAIGVTFVRGKLLRPTREQISQLVKFSKYVWASAAESRAWSNVDILALGLFVTVPVAFIGAYGVAWQVAGIISIFSTSISSAMFPQISKASSSGDETRVGYMIGDAIAFNGLLMIPGLVGGLLLSRRILTIYGPDFVVGASVLAPIILGRLLYNYQHQFSNVLNAIDRPRYAMHVSVLFIFLNVVLNLVFIEIIGGVGAAYATVLSAGLSLVVSYLYCRRLITFDIPFDEIGKQIVSAFVMGVVVLYLKGMVPPGTLVVQRVLNTGLLVFVGAIVYAGAIFVLSQNFRQKVQQNAPFRL